MASCRKKGLYLWYSLLKQSWAKVKNTQEANKTSQVKLFAANVNGKDLIDYTMLGLSSLFLIVCLM